MNFRHFPPAMNVDFFLVFSFSLPVFVYVYVCVCVCVCVCMCVCVYVSVRERESFLMMLGTSRANLEILGFEFFPDFGKFWANSTQRRIQNPVKYLRWNVLQK